MIPTTTTTKTNRRLSLVSTNMAPMQQVLEDGSLNDEIHQQKRQNFAFNNSTGNGIDPAQTKKKLQERLQRNAANSISSTAQPSNQTTQGVNNLPTSSPVTPMSQISVRTHSTPDPAAVLLASPNSNLAIPPPIYNNSNNNPRNYTSNQFKANTTNSSYLNQSMMNPMVPLQKQLTVTPITASPGASNAGQSPTQQSISPSNLLQQQQQHHIPNTLMQQQQPILQSPAQTSQNNLMNYSNNSTNPSQQVYSSNNNTGSSFINDNNQQTFMPNNLDQQYQMYNNDDASFYSNSNDNEIIMDDQLSRNSNSIRKQSTADFVKKQLGNTVNKRILQSSKPQDNYYHSSTSNEMYLPASPSSNPVQPMSSLTVNTNNLMYQQKQNPIMSPPVLMLNGQQTNDQMISNNNFTSPVSYSTPTSNNLAISPQPSLISPSNNNYMSQQQSHQKLFNSQQSYQTSSEYSQTNNQYGKYVRQPQQQIQQSNKFNTSTNDRFNLDSSSNNFLQQTINDEFDLNFIQSNESNTTNNQEEVEQKQLVQLIQQGNEVNNYQYQQTVKQVNNNKQNYQSINSAASFYRQQQQFQQQPQQSSYNSYNNSFSASSQQIRIEQSNMYQPHQNNQSIYNNNMSNDLLINDEPGGSLLQQLLLD